MLVLPDKADVSKGKVSVMAPIGVALLGYRKGQEVTWEVPAGKKHFKIVEVQNAAT
jgi:regulator of nucleoside diphosphate kinase